MLGFEVIQQASVQLTAAQVGAFYPAEAKSANWATVLKYMLSDKVLALVLKRDLGEVVEQLLHVVGPDSKEDWSQPTHSRTLRGRFAEGKASPLLDAVHASKSATQAKHEIQQIFKDDLASQQQSLFACVLPDVVSKGFGPAVIASLRKVHTTQHKNSTKPSYTHHSHSPALEIS